ncbi:hypothetical protein BDV96DRAFT_603821 [Lophiotrema nucula]|uniref:Uncharacterized protein n=1 Tax=Lophiotrema nucula TaxID=690887 RepID=A0A6A5YU89_9PLEO|nr:hypothetical protein BDV96DRAFT_603821 [Lophiotrema nucula]
MDTSNTTREKASTPSTPGRSKFSSVPTELLIKIADNIWVSTQADFEIQSEYDDDEASTDDYYRARKTPMYQNLVAFCQLNQACRRVGQELRFRNLDLTSDPVNHLLGDLRTLLIDIPGLQNKVKSIRWRIPRYVISDPQKDMYARAQSYDESLSEIANGCSKLAIPESFKGDLLRRVGAHDAIAWMRVLIMSTPASKKLDISDVFADDRTHIVKELSSMCSQGLLDHLEHLCLRSDDDQIDLIETLLNNDNILRLRNLTTLELHGTNRWKLSNLTEAYRGAASGNWEGRMENNELPRIYEIQNLILHKPPWLSYYFPSTFSRLTSLTLVLEDHKLVGAEEEHVPFIPNLVACGLEHLRIDFRRNEDGDGLFFWPHDFSMLTELKTLRIEGGLFLYHERLCDHFGDGSFSNICMVASDFFPPKIQELTYVPDRVETAGLVGVHEPLEELVREDYPGPKAVGNFCIREFLRHGVHTRPTLEKVTVSSDLFNILGFGDLVDQLAEEGVQMIGRAQADEDSELDRLYGSDWRDWREEGLLGLIEFDSD